jgi:plasmid maintenance system antidote protein VapI
MSTAERLQRVITQLSMSPYQFAKEIGAKRADVIYNVLKGRNEISRELLKKITATYPNLRADWLQLGEGEMFTWKDAPEKKSAVAEDETKYSGNLVQQLKDRDFIIQEQQRIITQQRELIDSLLNK